MDHRAPPARPSMAVRRAPVQAQGRPPATDAAKTLESLGPPLTEEPAGSRRACRVQPVIASPGATVTFRLVLPARLDETGLLQSVEPTVGRRATETVSAR